MAREVFIIHNVSTNNIELQDFGVIIPPDVSIDLANFDQAYLSSEVDGYLLDGDLVRFIDGVSVGYSDAFNSQIPISILDTNIGGTNIYVDSSLNNINLAQDIKQISSLGFNHILEAGEASMGEAIIRWNENVEGLVVGTQYDGVEFGLVRDNAFLAIALQDIPKGRAVSIIDSSNHLPTIQLTDGTSLFANVAGVSVTDISTGEQGYIQYTGKVENLDMSEFGEGDYLRLDSSTHGTFSDNTPAAPNPITFIGIVTGSEASTGSILLTINNGPRLSYLPDVNARYTAANDDILIYNGTEKYWDNKNFSTALTDAGVALTSYNAIQDASITALKNSLAQTDVSVAYIVNNYATTNSVDSYNAIQDTSIATIISDYATTNYVDTKVFRIDLSINSLYANKADTAEVDVYNAVQDASILLRANITYVDGSLATRDNRIDSNESSIGNLYDQEFLRESSMGTDFYWNGNVVDLSTAFKNQIANSASEGYQPFYFKDGVVNTNFLRTLESQNGLIIYGDGSTSILDSSIYVPGAYTYTGTPYSGNLNFHIPFLYFNTKLTANRVSNVTSFSSATGVTQVSPYDVSAQFFGDYYPWGTSSWDASGTSSLLTLTDWIVFYQELGENVRSSWVLDVSNLSEGPWSVYADHNNGTPILVTEQFIDREPYPERCYLGHVGVVGGKIKVWHESPDLFGTTPTKRSSDSYGLKDNERTGIDIYVVDASTVGMTGGHYYLEGASFRDVDFYNGTFTGDQNSNYINASAPVRIVEVDPSLGFTDSTIPPRQDIRTYSNRYYDTNTGTYIDSSALGKYVLSAAFLIDDGRFLLSRGGLYDTIDEAIGDISNFSSTSPVLNTIVTNIHPKLAYIIMQTNVSDISDADQYVMLETAASSAAGGGGGGGISSATNIGLGTGVYKDTISGILQFKTLATNGSDIVISEDSNTVYIDASIKSYDASINQIAAESAAHDAIQDASIKTLDGSVAYLFTLPNLYTTFDYVDGSLAARDTSIQWLVDNTYTTTYIDGSLNVKADLTYVDASLIARDTVIDEKVDGTGTTGIHNPVAYWTGTKTINDDALFVFDPTNNRLGIGTAEFDADAPESLKVDAGVTTSYTVARFQGQIDDYLQLEVKNNSGGPNASADLVVSTSNSTEDIGYVNLGINSPNYNGTFVGNAYDSYLYSLSANLLIGNVSTGQDVIFFTNGENAYTNERLRITTDGSILIGQPASENNLLEVGGDINLPAGSNYKINEIPLYSNTYIDGSLNEKLSADSIASLSSLQIERTTDFAATTTWTNISFDTTSVATDSSTLSIDSVNTDRINVGATGTYFAAAKVIPTNGTSQRYDIRLRRNDTTIIPGSESFVDIYAGESHELTLAISFDASQGDYISLQGLAEVAGTFQADTGWTITKLDGIKGVDGTDGSDGAPGPAGSGSTINVANEGTTIVTGPFDKLNFIGSGVTATADGSTADITIVVPAASVYGTEYQIASSTAVSSTTATTPQTKTTLVTSSLPAGDYKVTAHWMTLHSSATTSAYFDLTLGGTAQGVTTTISREYKDATNWESLSRSYFLTLSGVNTFAFRYWNEANSTSVSDAHIELIRVS